MSPTTEKTDALQKDEALALEADTTEAGQNNVVALSATSARGLPESKSARWGKSIVRTALWFGAAFLVTSHISSILPAQPIVVRTNSIDTGIYWLNLKARSLARTNFITFEFKPSTEQLRDRYPASRHTKMLMGLPGDTVSVNEEGKFKVCSGPHPYEPVTCHDVGEPLKVDTQGRPMTPWLEAGASHTLGADEYWVYAPNPKSLDSRYNGPISRVQILGTAKPVWIWRSHTEEFG